MTYWNFITEGTLSVLRKNGNDIERLGRAYLRAAKTHHQPSLVTHWLHHRCAYLIRRANRCRTKDWLGITAAWTFPKRNKQNKKKTDWDITPPLPSTLRAGRDMFFCNCFYRYYTYIRVVFFTTWQYDINTFFFCESMCVNLTWFCFFLFLQHGSAPVTS